MVFRSRDDLGCIELEGFCWSLKQIKFNSLWKNLWFRICHFGSIPIILKSCSDEIGDLNKVISKRELSKYLKNWVIMESRKRIKRWAIQDVLFHIKTKQMSRKTMNMLADTFLKHWKAELFANSFRRIWNFEDLLEIKKFQESKLCGLCFARITCPNDLATIDRMSMIINQERVKGLDMAMVTLCYPCQELVQKGDMLMVVLEKFLPVRCLIALFVFIFYLGVLSSDLENSCRCSGFDERFKYNWGRGSLNKKWCPMFNRSVTCHSFEEVQHSDGSISNHCNYKRRGRIELF